MRRILVCDGKVFRSFRARSEIKTRSDRACAMRHMSFKEPKLNSPGIGMISTPPSRRPD